MLENVVWGNTVENWGISILIVLGTVIITKLISLFNGKVIRPLTRKTKNHLDDIIYDSLESPILFGIVLIGVWVAIRQLTLSEGFMKSIDHSYRILIVLNITWFIARLCNSLLETYWINPQGNKEKKHAGKMMPVVKRSILTVVWIIGIVMALSNIGIDITALLGTLGIGGIAFALAAQDTIKNIFGAFTILTDRPFTIGDIVRIDSYEGTIIDVGARSTKMRDYDRRVITFPNYKIADASIVNISSEPMRRVTMKIGLTYDTNFEKMSEAMELLRSVPERVKFVSPKDLVAHFSDFADSALVITFVYFIEKKGNIKETISNVNLDILSSYNKAGLSFAFPSQTLYIEKGEANLTVG